jgi:hypothetical protein
VEAATPPPPPQPAPAGRRPIDVGRVISESFRLYSDNVAALLLSALVIFVISGLLQGLLASGGFLLNLLGWVVGLAATALYTGFVVKLVEDVRDGRRDFSAGELMSSASHHIVPLIINGILRGFAIAIGLLLLIVPGLYLLTIWAVCSPAIVSEDRDAFDAFGRSNELTAGERMSVFLTILLAFLITVAVTTIIAIIGVAIAGVAGGIVFSIIAGTLTAPIAALVATVLFFDLGGGPAAAAADDSQVVVEY